MTIITLSAARAPGLGDTLVIHGGIVPPGWWITRELGRGGQAIALELRNATGARRALKVDTSACGDGDTRLRREADLLNQVASPYLPQLHEVREAGGRLGLVLDLLDGIDLRRWLCVAPLSGRIRAVLDVARAAEVLHRAGVVHRDISPMNVRVVVARSGPRAVLFDLGIALSHKGAKDATAEPATLTGASLGTLGYAAPEQLNDGHSATPRSDVFSLGALLYEAVTGRPAFRARSISHAITQALARTWDDLDTSADHVPPAVRALIRRSLSPEPLRRPADGDGFRAALEAAWRSGAVSPPIAALEDKAGSRETLW